MVAVKFYFEFDKPDKIYYPGEMVTGKVRIVLESEMKIRGIELKIKGEATCKWYVHRGRHTYTRKSSKIYFNTEQILIGGRDEFKLSTGEYTYPFSMMLPLKVPSSFSGTYGKILYYVRVKIDIPFALDETEQAAFTIINPLNLELFPHLRTPYRNETNKTFCCLCCTSGPLTVIAHLPKTVYAATESIPITLKVENASNVSLNAINVRLRRKIRWTAGVGEGLYWASVKDRRYENFELQNLRIRGVREGQSQTYSENFTIPSIPFPNLDGCAFIEINHELHIKTEVAGMYFNLGMHIPIIIVDLVVAENPDDSIITPPTETFTYNIACNPGMEVPAGKVPRPYPIHTVPPEYPENSGVAPFGAPFLQICPPAPLGHMVTQSGINNALTNSTFVASRLHSNTGEIPQMPTQENSALVQKYPPQAPSVLPSLSPQPATNPGCSQNSRHHLVTNELQFPTSDNEVELENT